MMGGSWIVALAAAGILLGVAGVEAQVSRGVTEPPPRAAGDLRPLLQALWLDIPAQPLIAPDFALPDLNGGTVRLAALRGRTVLIYFWTTY